MALPPIGLDPRTPARHLPPPWGRSMAGIEAADAPDALQRSVQQAAREAAQRKPLARKPERSAGHAEAATPELVCPVCGNLARSQKCKVVCAVCHTLIMNCSEF